MDILPSFAAPMRVYAELGCDCAPSEPLLVGTVPRRVQNFALGVHYLRTDLETSLSVGFSEDGRRVTPCGRRAATSRREPRRRVSPRVRLTVLNEGVRSASRYCSSLSI